MRIKELEKKWEGRGQAPVDTISREGSQLVILWRSVCSLAGVLVEEPSVEVCVQSGRRPCGGAQRLSSADDDGVSPSLFMAAFSRGDSRCSSAVESLLCTWCFVHISLNAPSALARQLCLSHLPTYGKTGAQ